MSILKLFYQLARRNLAGALLSVLFSGTTILSSVALFGLSAYIISFCSLRPSIADIAVAVVGVRFFGLARGISRYVERLVSHNTTFRLLGNLRVWLYQRIEALPPYESLVMDKQDVFSRIVDDIETLQEFYLRTFTPFVVSVIVGIVGFFLLLAADVTTAVLFLLFYVMVILALPVFVFGMTKGLHKRLVLDKKEYKVRLLDYMEGMAEIVSNSATNRWRSHLDGLLEQNVENQRHAALWRSLSGALVMLVTNLAMVACLVSGMVLVQRGTLQPVYLAVVALSVSALFEGTAAIPQMLQKLEQSRTAAERIIAVAGGLEAFGLSGMDINSVEAGVTSEEADSFDKVVRLDQVSFQYPSQKEWALCDIDITLEPGKKLGIVGASGSGKSTLGYLLLGWLKPQKGTITPTLDESWFATVNQQAYFFNTTIRGNLLVGDVTAKEEQLNQALQAAQLLQHVEGLPEGLDTEIGETGMKLSGGQRQRLAIARALLKRSNILLMDEPTAGLDAETEHKLLDTVYATLEGRGLVLITHRLVEMDRLDEILVMDRGRIVERGTHESLLRAKGVYCEMIRLQNSVL